MTVHNGKDHCSNFNAGDINLWLTFQKYSHKMLKLPLLFSAEMVLLKNESFFWSLNGFMCSDKRIWRRRSDTLELLKQA